MQKRIPIKSNSNNFTLIELLVVIAIIAILASMLLPALKSARDRGKASVCTSNLKQIGYSTVFYANDYDGYAPAPLIAGVTYWSRILIVGEYIKGSSTDILTCPSWYPYHYSGSGGGVYETYGMRANGDSGLNEYSGHCFNIAQSKIQQRLQTDSYSTSQFPIFGDSTKATDANLKQCNVFFTSDASATAGAVHDIHCRHFKQANLWFADGSVRGCGKSEITDDYGVNSSLIVDYY